MRRLVAVATVTILGGALLTGCLIQPKVDYQPLAPGEQSRLDEAGQDRIKSIGHLRLDLSDLCLTVEEVGFPNPQLGSERFGTEDRDIEMELIGPLGTLQSSTRAVTTYPDANAGRISMVEWFVSEDNAAESRARLEADAAMLGLSDEVIDGWSDWVEGVKTGEFENSLKVIGLGVSPTGFVMDIQGNYNATTNNEVYIYAIYLNPAFNTPEVKAAWGDYPSEVEPVFDDDWTC